MAEGSFCILSSMIYKLIYIRIVIALCLFISLSMSCQNAKPLEVQQKPSRSFILGSGDSEAGFITYKVFNNGVIKRWNAGVEDYDEFKQIPLDSTKACFMALDALDIGYYQWDKPGETTYFIELSNAEGLNLIKWGDPEEPISPDIDAFFGRIKTMLESNYR